MRLRSYKNLSLGRGTRKSGGGGGVAAPDLSVNFSDAFTGQITSTPLYTRSGWGAWNSTAAADANRSRLLVINEEVSHDGTTGGNNYLVGQNFGAPAQVGCYLRFKVPTAVPLNMRAAVNGVDEANCIGLGFTSGLVWFKRVAGVETTVSLTGDAIQVGDLIEVFGTDLNTATPKLTVYRNGGPYTSGGGTSIVANSQGYNINTSGSAAVIGTKVGFLTGPGSNSTRFDDYYASTMAGSVTLANNAALFYPSEFNNLGASASDYTGRTIAVSGTYSTSGTTPTGMQIAVVDELNPNTTYQAFTNVTGFTASGGNWSGNVRILPTPQTGRMVARFANDTSIKINSSTTIACGPTAMAYGQSNAANSMLFSVTDSSISAYVNRNSYAFDRLFLSVTASAWRRNESGGQPLVLARVLSDAFGLTCGVTGGGIGSQPSSSLRKTAPITTFADPYNGNVQISAYQHLTNCIAAAQATGNVAFVFYDQGEAEGATTGSDESSSSYISNVSSIFSDIRADFAGGRNVLGCMTITGRGDSAVAANQNNNYSMVRAAQKSMTSTIPNCIVGQHNVGVLMGDADHYVTGVRGKTEKLRRLGRSIIRATLGTGYSGAGPQTLTATISGGKIILPVTLNGAASLSVLSGLDGTTAGNASALTSWEVSGDNFATTRTLTSVALVGNNIEITPASAPVSGDKVRWHWGKNPTITSVVFGVYADGTNIALEPLVNPVTAV